MMKIDRLVRVTKKENSNGSSSTELEWEPGSKKEILKGAAAGAALGSIVPVIGTGIGAAIGGTLGLIFGKYKKKKDFSLSNFVEIGVK